VLAAVAAFVPAHGAGDRVPQPTWPQARERVSDTQGCIEPTALMRKDHMKFLLFHRDELVHEGVRSKQYSLVGCVNCHASTDAAGKPIAINAPGQFCQSCHTYVSVSMDCFQCHATTPAKTSSSGRRSAHQSTAGVQAPWMSRMPGGWEIAGLAAANFCVSDKAP
jgi:hypothetical protein